MRLLALRLSVTLALAIPALSVGSCTIASATSPDPQGIAMASDTFLTILVSAFSILVFGGLALVFATPRGPSDRLARCVGLAATGLLFTFFASLGLRATVGRGIYDGYLLIVGVLVLMAIASFFALAADLLGMDELPPQEA